MPAAIPIVAAVAGSATSAIGNKLSQPKVDKPQPFDPRLPTQTMDLFSQSGAGDPARAQFGQQLLTALSGSLAKFGGGPAPTYDFAAHPNFSPEVTPVPGAAPAAAPRGAGAQGSVGGLLQRMGGQMAPQA